jgi:hypothetical protein
MPVYTNNLRLKEITTGDEDGTWGDSTNANLELIGEAFGYGTEEMAADLNETFTMADYATDAVRGFFLEITSAVPLTNTRTVTLGPNTINKVWIIKNSTTGGQSITIKQGSGSTINITNGTTNIVYADGAGAGAAVAKIDLIATDDIGTTIQGWGAVLDDFNTLGAATTDGEFIVADGAGSFTYETGATARTSMGAQTQGDALDDINTLGAASADNQFLVSTGAGVLAWESDATVRTSMGLGSLATQSSVDLTTDVTGDLPYSNLAQASAASRLLGRGSAGGAGDWQELTLGANLSLSGTVLNTTGVGDVTAAPTPLDSQIAVWTGATTIEGDAAFTFDTTTDTLNIGATNDGTLTIGGVTIVNNAGASNVSLNGINSLDATTEGTIESAIDTLPNLATANSLTSATSLSILEAQISDLGAYITGASPTITTPTLTLKTGTAPTGEGVIEWQSTNDTILVGDGAGTKIFSSDADLSITESQISDLQSYLLNINAESINDLTDVNYGTPAKGDILAYNSVSGDYEKLAVGSNSLVLTADSGETLGVKWAAIGGGDVSAVPTPSDGQIAVWASGNTIEGDAALSFDTTTDTLAFGATNDGTLTIGGVTIVDNAGAGSVSLNNIDSFDATTLSTIESANITALPNLAQTGTVTSGTWNSAITLASGTTPTSEGVMQWNTTNDTLVIGDGAATQTFVASNDVSGDINMSTTGAVTIQTNAVETAMIADDQVTYGKIQNVVANDVVLGNIGGAGGIVDELTGTEVTALLDAFTDSLPGLATASGGGTTNYLRADGTWAAPPGGAASDSFANQTVTDTDSGYTWAETGTAVADGQADTLTWVSGSLIDIDVDATNDAIRIASTLDTEYANLTTAEIQQLQNIGATTISADNWTAVAALSGSNTGDEPAASTSVAGIVELADITETNTGTSDTLAVTPDGLDGWTGSVQITTLGTIATGTWEGTDVGVLHGGTGASTALAAMDNLVSGTGFTQVAPAAADLVIIQDVGDSSNVKVATAQAIADLGGGGDVSASPTPSDGQIAVWVDGTTIEGDAALTFNTVTNDLVIAAGGILSFGAVNILSDSAGTTTLNNIDAIDATTENTLEAAIDSLSNLTQTGTVTSGTWSSSVSSSATITLASGTSPTTEGVIQWDTTNDRINIGTGGGTATFVSTADVSGDITMNTAGAVTLANSAVEEANIQDEAVTLAKMAHMATNSFLGRDTAGTGDVEVLSATDATALLDTFSTTTTTQGVVPGSNNGGATVYLDGTGAWSTPAGSSSDSYRTHTVTDTDSGYTWADTGSAVAASATDTLTWVSGSLIEIDVDATNDAIRVSSTIANGVEALTTAEVNQLEAIGATTISATQWGYLGGATTFGGDIMQDADAAAGRTTLGLGSLAVQSTVGTTDIDNDAVTYAKIQNVVADDRILGNNAGAGGVVDELTGTEVTNILFGSVTTNVAAATGDKILVADVSDSDNPKYVTASSIAALSTTTVFADDVFRIEDNVDDTRELAFSVGGITTGTTRTWTVPDTDIDFTVLSDIASLSVTDGNIMVGNNSTWVAESGATARTSLGAQTQGDVLDDLNTLGAAGSANQFIVSTGAGVFAYETGNTALGSLGVTATTTELNYNDITALGTVQNSKTVTADSSGVVDFSNQTKTIEGALIVDEAVEYTDLGSGGGTRTFNLATAHAWKVTVSTSTNTFSFTNPSITGTETTVVVEIVNGGSQTVNHPTGTDWASGVAPTLTTAGTDIVVYRTTDAGTTWFAAVWALDIK